MIIQKEGKVQNKDELLSVTIIFIWVLWTILLKCSVINLMGYPSPPH